MEKSKYQSFMIKDRMLKGWTIMRVVYLMIGLLIIIQGVHGDQWPGILLGAYISSMGLFSFGCAGGNCSNGNCDIQKDSEK